MSLKICIVAALAVLSSVEPTGLAEPGPVTVGGESNTEPLVKPDDPTTPAVMDATNGTVMGDINGTVMGDTNGTVIVSPQWGNLSQIFETLLNETVLETDSAPDNQTYWAREARVTLRLFFAELNGIMLDLYQNKKITVISACSVLALGVILVVLVVVLFVKKAKRRRVVKGKIQYSMAPILVN